MKQLNSVAVFLICVGIGPGIAQSQEQPGARSSEVLLDEIIVTARKREERLQDIPMSVSAFTGTALEIRGFNSIDKLQNVTPNLTFYDSSPLIAGGNSATMFIRGIGQIDYLPASASDPP